MEFKYTPATEQVERIDMNRDEHSIKMSIDDVEYIKMTPEGFYVKGEKVEDKNDIYNAFWDWVVKAGYKDNR